MYQLYVIFCVILSLFHGGSTQYHKENSNVTVECDPKSSGTLYFGFRINNIGPELLFKYKESDKKIECKNNELKAIKLDKVKVTLTITSFKKKTDSGLYICAAFNSNNLLFGSMTRISGEPDPVTQPPKIAPTIKTMPEVTTTKTQCICKKDPKRALNCETWILSSLASGCGLLLTLLIITILYCNRLRTRRCPHHYKKQPRNRPASQPKLPNNHF